MALPTVHYTNFAAGTSRTFAELLPALHTNLIAAGWTIEYADTDAIGTGSASTPAWDKTPALATTAGLVIYQMPANGFTRQWFVQIEGAWLASASILQFTVTVGTGQVGGVLSGAGTPASYSLTVSNSSEWIVSSSEDGFFLGSSFSNIVNLMHISCERARSLSGAVGEDLIMQGFAQAGSVANSAPDRACFRYRASDGFEYAVGSWAVLLMTFDDFDAVYTPALHPSFTDYTGENGIVIGPYATSGTIAGVPRLFALLVPADATVNSDHPVYVDGGVKLYRTPAVIPSSAWVWIAARE